MKEAVDGRVIAGGGGLVVCLSEGLVSWGGTSKKLDFWIPFVPREVANVVRVVH